jgi:hypothetical protein
VNRENIVIAEIVSIGLRHVRISSTLFCTVNITPTLRCQYLRPKSSYRAENRRKFRVIKLRDNPGLPFSDTGANDGFSPPRSGCTKRSKKNCDDLLGDSSVIFGCHGIAEA